MLIKLRNGIENTMKVILAIIADYFKVFDTINFDILLRKMHRLNFSTDLLHWTLSYLYNRKHFEQTNVSTFFTFIVWSVSGINPLIQSFVLLIYQILSIIANLFNKQMTLRSKVEDIAETKNLLESELSHLMRWSKETNLTFNQSKAKFMIIGTKQVVRVHVLDKRSIRVICNEKPLEPLLLFSFKLLGTLIDKDFDWTKYTNKTAKQYFSSLSTLNKLQRFSPFHM